MAGAKLRRGEMVKDRLASQQTVPEQTSILFERVGENKRHAGSMFLLHGFHLTRFGTN